MGGNKLPSAILAERIERALNMFPDLQQRTHDLAASLSGGERQMLAISRALISDPTFLLLDEPTAALSPLYQQQIIERIDALREEGITVLIVEQNARLSLARSDRGYIFASGKVVHTGDAQHILTDPEIGEYFLGSHWSFNEKELSVLLEGWNEESLLIGVHPQLLWFLLIH